MSAARHQHAAASITRPIRCEHVGNTIADDRLERPFAACGEALRAEWVRRSPRSRRIDYGPGENLLLSGSGFKTNTKCRMRALFVALHLVATEARNTDHASAELQAGTDRGDLTQRLQITGNDV